MGWASLMRTSGAWAGVRQRAARPAAQLKSAGSPPTGAGQGACARHLYGRRLRLGALRSGRRAGVGIPRGQRGSVAKALILTEKPSVARDIAAALGGFTEHDGYWESDAYLVTFAVGHLFELLEPEEIDPKYKRWTLDDLPILPERFQLKKKKGQSDRVRVIEKLAERKDVDRIVNACDAGREGELIFREVVTYLGVEKPIERLWLQSMTTDAIRDGFARLRPGRELEGLARPPSAARAPTG